MDRVVRRRKVSACGAPPNKELLLHGLPDGLVSGPTQQFKLRSSALASVSVDASGWMT